MSVYHADRAAVAARPRVGLLFRTRRYRKPFGSDPGDGFISSGTQLKSSNTLAGNGSPKCRAALSPRIRCETARAAQDRMTWR